MHFSYSQLQDDYCQLENEESGPRTKYMGCIKVKTSMRTLSNRTRYEVATESIYRICEANNIKRNSDRKRLDTISSMLDDEPNLGHSGEDVQLSVTSNHITVISRDKKETIVQHEMPNVSFASSGDEDTQDYVAYVAKNETHGRACFVLECGSDTAKSVLNIIRRAFDLRTQQFLRFPNSCNGSNYLKTDSHNFSLTSSTSTVTTLDLPNRNTSENQRNDSVIAKTREKLEKEPWFHGSNLSREESETRLKQDGDFLVRESKLEPGSFVLSVMNVESKFHIIFDDFDEMGQVRTKEMIFNDISRLVNFHKNENLPIKHENRTVYLRKGVSPHPNHT